MPVTMIFWDFFTKFRKLPHVRAFFWLLVEVNINFFKKKKTKKVIRCLERRFEAEFRVHPKGVDEEFRQMNSEIAKNKMRNLAGFIPEIFKILFKKIDPTNRQTIIYLLVVF